MSVIATFSTRCRRRLRAEDGSTILVALSILLITSLLTGGLLTLILSDTGLTNTDVQGKRAYVAAQSGVQYYLGQLNASASSATWWQTCSNDSTSSAVAVPGTAGESYTYQPVVNSCSGTNAVGTVLDPNTGLLRMKFTGYAGTNGQHRTIVADFRPITPLSYLWFTVSETVDPSSAVGQTDNCNGAAYSSGSASTNSGCWLTWGGTDVINGPMYTQDQFYISTSGSGPTFGRNAQDTIAASGAASSVCVTGSGSSVPTTHACPSSVTMNGTPKPGAPIIPLPDQNQQLSTDAASYGIVLNPGTTTLTLAVNGSGQTIIQSGVTCTTTSSSSCVTTAANGTALAGLNLSTSPVVYAPSPSSATCPTYNPSNVTYPAVSGGTYSGSFTGACGDLYVSGTYSSSLTLAAADDVIVTGNLLNSVDTNPTGTASLTGAATLGLVANQYVRVYRPVSNPSSTNCASNSATPGDITIDGAILALAHSFAVDNYDCGTPGTLTIHGAIAQKYRGAVGTGNSNGTVVTGYSKNYNYDNRFKYVMPPYVFDLQNTSWNLVRETEANGS
jgi:Tfp pilus assembly protein PilX